VDETDQGTKLVNLEALATGNSWVEGSTLT
jgi:hypothetical protein